MGQITQELMIHVTYSELFCKVSMVENTFQCINLLRNGLIAMEKRIKIFLSFELQKVKHTKFHRDDAKIWFAAIKYLKKSAGGTYCN